MVFSAGGYLLAAAAVRSDRRAAAARDAALASRRVQVLLEHARVYVNGVAGLLASQQAAGQRQFAFLVGTNSASFGLVDALWIRDEAGSLIAKYATTIMPGVNVSGWPALAAPIRSQHIVFGVNATEVGSFGGQSGFYLLESTRFGRAPGSSGYLAVFVPRGWLTLSLGEDPRDVAVRLDGHLLEGRLKAQPAATVRLPGAGAALADRPAARATDRTAVGAPMDRAHVAGGRGLGRPARRRCDRRPPTGGAHDRADLRSSLQTCSASPGTTGSSSA